MCILEGIDNVRSNWTASNLVKSRTVLGSDTVGVTRHLIELHGLGTIIGQGKLPLSRTGPKSEQPTFKSNICFNSAHRTSKIQSSHSQEPCELFGSVQLVQLQVLLVKLEQILHLKVDCSDQGQFTLHTYYCSTIFIGYVEVKPLVNEISIGIG